MIYSGLRLLLGVSSSIAAYRALDIASSIVKGGGEVQAVLTPNTINIVGTAAFDAITQRRAVVNLWGSDHSGEMDHLAFTKWANVFAVAPATAATVARLSLGLADDALGTFALAWPGAMVIAPAMNPTMYLNPTVQRHIAELRSRGHRIVEPGVGPTACGDLGRGRLADVDDILIAIVDAMRGRRDLPNLRGKRLLVTSGPTREFADPVRCITNPSTGRMGAALARQALAAGAEVFLITGPTDIALPCAQVIERVTTAEEMNAAVQKHLPAIDAAIFAAAVSDWKPAEQAAHKAKKEDGPAELSLRLVRTPDIASEANRNRRQGQVFVGFAAESENLVANARDKMHRKGFDIVIANPINIAGAGFASDDNEAVIVTHDGERNTPRMTKDSLAIEILCELAKLLKPAES